MTRKSTPLCASWPWFFAVGAFVLHTAFNANFPSDVWLSWALYGIATASLVFSFTLFFISRKIAAESPDDGATDEAPDSSEEHF